MSADELQQPLPPSSFNYFLVNHIDFSTRTCYSFPMPFAANTILLGVLHEKEQQIHSASDNSHPRLGSDALPQPHRPDTAGPGVAFHCKRCGFYRLKQQRFVLQPFFYFNHSYSLRCIFLHRDSQSQLDSHQHFRQQAHYLRRLSGQYLNTHQFHQHNLRFAVSYHFSYAVSTS